MSHLRTWLHFYCRNHSSVLRNLILLGNLCFKSIAKTLACFKHLQGLTTLFRTSCKTSLSWVKLKDSFLPVHWQIPWKPAIWRNQIEQSSLKAWESPSLDLPPSFSPSPSPSPFTLLSASPFCSLSLSIEELLLAIDCHVYQCLKFSIWTLNLFYCAHLLLLN